MFNGGFGFPTNVFSTRFACFKGLNTRCLLKGLSKYTGCI